LKTTQRESEGVGGSGEKWPKQCTHIWINELQKREKKTTQRSSTSKLPHASNPSYFGDWDQEDHSSSPAQANSSWDITSKLTRAKWSEGVAQMVEHLLCKNEALNSNPSPTKKKKKKKKPPSYFPDWEKDRA
jgi:hypothetical protein